MSITEIGMTYDYDLLVIGAGPAGGAAAKRAAKYGARVAIVEQNQPGGTCVNRGCIPKKLMVYAADFANLTQDATGYGWHVSDVQFEWQRFTSAMQQSVQRSRQAQIQALADAGVELINHHATFLDPHTLTVGDQKLTAETVLIAVGGKPIKPEISGIEYALTSDEMFGLKQLPQRIAIIGGGYIGVEFASILCGFGVQVTLMNHEACILEGFDDDLRVKVRDGLMQRGIQIFCNTTTRTIEKVSEGFHLTLEGDCPQSLKVDAILCATGRAPNLEGLGLENAGVEANKKAIAVDDQSRTNQPNIFAIGDCASRKQLTPVARAEGIAFSERVFGKHPNPIDYQYVPSTVCARPEAATVGLTEAEAREQLGDAVQCYRTEFQPLFYAPIERTEPALLKVVVDGTSDRVLGIHIVGQHAAEILQGFVPALQMGVTKQQLDQTIGIHPSSAEELFDLDR